MYVHVQYTARIFVYMILFNPPVVRRTPGLTVNNTAFRPQECVFSSAGSQNKLKYEYVYSMLVGELLS